MNLKSLLQESRPTRIVNFIQELKKMSGVDKVVEVSTTVDGMAALVRMTDGNAYEVEIRQASYTRHPTLQKKTR